MTKIKTSQTSNNYLRRASDEDEDEFNVLLNNSDSDDEKKTYFRTFIRFPETNQVINALYIQSIEMSFRLKESTTNFEAEPTSEYGILINTGVTPGMNSPKSDIELWYKNEYYRDQRYKSLMDRLDEIGIKVITI